MEELLEKISTISSDLTDNQIEELEEEIEDRGFIGEDRENLINLRAIENTLDLIYMFLDNSRILSTFYPESFQAIQLTLDSIEFYINQKDYYKAVICAEELIFQYMNALNDFFSRREVKNVKIKNSRGGS